MKKRYIYAIIIAKMISFGDAMEYGTLSDLITYLEYGTNIYIGTLFFSNYGSEKLKLPFLQTIHDSPVCNFFKTTGKNGYKRCFKCRELAIKKALTDKKEFGGFCINKVYEYTRPIVINEEVVAIIFIGNIATDQLKAKLTEFGQKSLICSLEEKTDPHSCSKIADIVEGYIRLILEKFPPENKKSANAFLIENIKTYIKLNLEYSITSSQIADVFNYNAKYLGRIFKKSTGMTMSQYLNRERINRACDLIKNSDANITDIAASVGFFSNTYFDRVFYGICGCTPVEYRKNEQKAHFV